MSRVKDSIVVRTSGIVLCVIGCVTFGVVELWNRSGDYPPEAILERVSGTVVLGQLRTITTRTSMEKWVVIDLYSDQKKDHEDERWVLPRHTPEWVEVVSSLEAGVKVSGRALAAPERLRWSDMPVRVIWSLSREGASEEPGADVELVTYAEVIAVEEALRHQSPIVGWMMIALGGALLLGSRLGVGAGRDLPTAS